MARVLPKTLDYSDVLPLAVESRSRRRTFFPINGQTFTSDGANILRFDLSADALLDTQHSYFRFNLKLNTRTCGMDFAGGHGIIKRLRISQSGTVLEDINSYNRLMGSIVLPCQSGYDHTNERSVTEYIRPVGGASATVNGQTQDQSFVDGNLSDIGAIAGSASALATTDGTYGGGAGGTTVISDAINTAVDTAVDAVSADIRTKVNAMTLSRADAQVFAGQLHNADSQLLTTNQYVVTIPLNSGLMNSDKLIPLMLMSAPLSVEIELAPSLEPFCWATDATGTYQISNCRYIANLVEVGGDVASQLRMIQEASGGVLTLAGQTYTHFNDSVLTGSSGDQVINVPARVKSMKSLFFASQGDGGVGQADKYGLSYGGNLKMNNFQLKIGSVVYPPTPVQCGFTDSNGGDGSGSKKGEAFMELAKAWGNVGSTKGLGHLADYTLYTNEKDQAGSVEPYRFAPFGLDLEAFQRVAIESGVNTADRALPISLVLDVDGTTATQVVDAFVLADALFYINADGTMSVSV
jgi:hypothetical protein